MTDRLLAWLRRRLCPPCSEPVLLDPDQPAGPDTQVAYGTFDVPPELEDAVEPAFSFDRIAQYQAEGSIAPWPPVWPHPTIQVQASGAIHVGGKVKDKPERHLRVVTDDEPTDGPA